MFLPAPFCGAEERGQHATIHGVSKMPKILTSDWLIVTALRSVIGHVFIASVQQCVCGQCIAVQWTVDTGEYRCAALGCNYRAG